jgi:hypothetical protein
MMKPVKLFFLTFLFFITQIIPAQQQSEAGVSTGDVSYITYLPGDMPLVISIPHGGYLLPDNIPERPCINCAKNQDVYTLEIGIGIRETIHSLTGYYPYVIINNLHRTRLDPNRNIEEAAVGNIYAEEAWHHFQDYIDSAAAGVTGKFGKGLYIDLHGHRHQIKRTELGYLLSSEELQLEDDMLDLGTFVEYSSIRNLVETNSGSLSFSQLIRGPSSLGSMLSGMGYPAVPGPEIPFPGPGEPYFSGGYNTTRHGSSGGGTIDGIQIELDLDVRTIQARREKLITDLSHLLLEYLRIHYFPDSDFTETGEAGNK